MILIDNNIKLTRDIFYFFKINNNLKNFKYIFFCYKKNNSQVLANYINSKKINYYFLKKLKSIKYLSFIKFYLKNSLVLYCTNDETILVNIIKELDNNIIFCKIDNNFYSLNNLKFYLNSKINLINYINTYYYNFIYTLDNLKKK